MSSFNDQIIAEFRHNNGYVASNGFGDSLVLLHSVGARSGAPRISPVMAIVDGDGWLVAASKAGAPEHPAWYFNLVAHPHTSVEVGGPQTVAIIRLVATDLRGADRDAAWARFTTRSAGFAAYEKRAQGRVIPVLRLARA